MEKRFYKLGEFADVLGVHRTTLWKWIKDGKIKVIKIGKSQVISATEIDRLEKGG